MKEIIRPKNIKMDPQFYSDALQKATHAKFSQNKELKHMLLQTKNGKLSDYIRGQDPNPNNLLMELRHKFTIESI